MVSAPVRRAQISFVCQRGRSVRRACALLSVAQSTVGYRSRLIERDASAVAAMRELAAQYPRYGYRRIQVLLERRGHAMSVDRAHRLWRLHQLQVPRKRLRRRVASSRPRPLPPTAAGQMLACDFVFDACANGQQLKCLTVVVSLRASVWPSMWPEASDLDEASKCSVGSLAFTAVRGICARIMGLSSYIDTAHIDPGKPWQNASNESFNGKFRDECLSMEWFRNRMDAKIVIDEVRRQYNEVRPHSSLGQFTPAEFKQQLGSTTNTEKAIS
jgi:putative transposase